MAEHTGVLVSALVSEVNAAGSSNQWDLESLREALREFLAELADEAVLFPDTLAKGQWSLFVADDDRAEAVAFVVAVVSSQRVVLVAGRGSWEAVRSFGDNFLPQDAFDAVPEASTLFGITREPLELTRADFDAWLNG